jgi:hypothetical protein
MVSHIRGPVAARGKIVAMAENWSEGDEQELVGRQWELYGGDIGYNRKDDRIYINDIHGY